MRKGRVTLSNLFWIVLLCLLGVLFVLPIFIVLFNSFKGQFYIASSPFSLPNSDTFVGLLNYKNGIEKIQFFKAFGYSLLITLLSVFGIILTTSMTAWYITRVKAAHSRLIYYALVFSMIVPFQMVMYTMSKVANVLRLESPLGIVVLYIGFGAGLSVFMFSGFIRSIPLALEEAAEIDGASFISILWRVYIPLSKPVYATLALFYAVGRWNGYSDALMYLSIKKQEFYPLQLFLYNILNSVNSVDVATQEGFSMPGLSESLKAAIVMFSTIPILCIYPWLQKYFIHGVTLGGVKE